MIGRISEDNPHFQAMKNYQDIHISGKKPSLSWVTSCCRYKDDIKCTLQIVLAERLILFGKDPDAILGYSLDQGFEFHMMSIENRKQVMELYIDKILHMYRNILR